MFFLRLLAGVSSALAAVVIAATAWAADLQTLVKGLNQMGLKPSDVIAILQAVKTAGALQAELVIQ